MLFSVNSEYESKFKGVTNAQTFYEVNWQNSALDIYDGQDVYKMESDCQITVNLFSTSL